MGMVAGEQLEEPAVGEFVAGLTERATRLPDPPRPNGDQQLPGRGRVAGRVLVVAHAAF